MLGAAHPSSRQKTLPALPVLVHSCASPSSQRLWVVSFRTSRSLPSSFLRGFPAWRVPTLTSALTKPLLHLSDIITALVHIPTTLGHPKVSSPWPYTNSHSTLPYMSRLCLPSTSGAQSLGFGPSANILAKVRSSHVLFLTVSK